MNNILNNLKEKTINMAGDVLLILLIPVIIVSMIVQPKAWDDLYKDDPMLGDL